jgi:hypothetical protein
VDLSEVCEKRLYREFYEGMEDINRETSKIEILNEKTYMDNFDVKIVDLAFIFGADIDRDENQANGLGEFRVLFSK